MRKVYNFGAGPGMLPEEVLRKAQDEMLDWRGTGVSVMELGHRSQEFTQLTQEIEADLRDVMHIPDNYEVLFLAGGATAQFSMVPMNLLAKNQKADYVVTGLWSEKAMTEAKRYGNINLAASSLMNDGVLTIPPQTEWQMQSDAAYLHYTPNETIAGLEFDWVPEAGDVPLVADMTSMILSRPIDVSQYGIIYAAAQKNAGQAGITIVIIRQDLIRDCLPQTPLTFQYQLQSKSKSVLNTPPTYSWYMTGLVIKWLKQQGGVNVLYQRNQQKAKLIYDAIDQSNGFYQGLVDPACRSIMNVAFFLKDQVLHEAFFKEAEQANLKYLKGHRSAGGVRASMYNPMPVEGAKALADFMLDFANRNG